MNEPMYQSTRQPTTFFRHTPRWCALLVISLLLQIAGCIAPGWMFLSLNYADIHIGLWWLVACVENKDCERHGYSEEPGYELYITQDGEDLSMYQAFVIISILCCLFSVILIVKIRSSTSPKFLLQLAGVSSLASGGFVVYTCAKLGSYNTELADLIGGDLVGFPYALFLSGIGGLLALIVCIWTLVVLCKTQQQQESGNGPQANLPPVPYLSSPTNHAMVSTTTNNGYDNTVTRM